MIGRLHHSTERGVFLTLALLSALLYMLYFVHLRADYPALLPGVDWARYTDEGWYGGAALYHARSGQWFVPNGFNPAVALPLWPLLLRAWFALTGPGIVAARVLTVLLFGATNLLLYALLKPLAGRVLATAALLLTLANPFCYGFDRIAILEPLVALLFLLALRIARPRRTAPGVVTSIATGILITALVLTKTTAVLLAPAVLYLLWQAARMHRDQAHDPTHSSLRATLERIAREPRAFLAPATAAATALLVWLAYFFLLVRPRHASDYHHLFVVNQGHASGHTLLQALARAVGDATWMGGLLWALTLLLLAASLRYLRELWRIPLFGAAALALVVPIAFIGWHTWFIPHYYLPCFAPMTLALTLGLHALSRRAHAPGAPRSMRTAHTLAMLTAEAAFALMLLQTLSTATHPRYTMQTATADIAARMHAGVPANAPQPKLLAASADTFALFTGIDSANPEWPIGGLSTLVAQERPTWYGGYLPYDAQHIARMRQLLPLTEVARYPIQPTPDHQVFVLYRIAP